MRNNYFLYPFIISVCLILAGFHSLYGQDESPVSNLQYRLDGSRMLISYDLAKSGSKNAYEIWLKVKTSTGKEIFPVSVFGDVKRGVVSGNKKSIIWDLKADDVDPGDNFSLEVLAKPEEQKEAIPDSIVHNYEFNHTTDLGLGLGLDYGGILGVRMTFMPIKYLGFFGCLGLQLSGVGWQVGSRVYLVPKTSRKGFRPNLKAMYGVNASIYVQDADQYNKLYRGFCVGPGMEFRFGKQKKHGLSVDINFPLRSDEYNDDWEKLKNDPTVEIVSEPLPFSLSFGYHLEF
jgi:hypothetical protein